MTILQNAMLSNPDDIPKSRRKSQVARMKRMVVIRGKREEAAQLLQ